MRNSSWSSDFFRPKWQNDRPSSHLNPIGSLLCPIKPYHARTAGMTDQNAALISSSACILHVQETCFRVSMFPAHSKSGPHFAHFTHSLAYFLPVMFWMLTYLVALGFFTQFVSGAWSIELVVISETHQNLILFCSLVRWIWEGSLHRQWRGWQFSGVRGNQEQCHGKFAGVCWCVHSWGYRYRYYMLRRYGAWNLWMHAWRGVPFSDRNGIHYRKRIVSGMDLEGSSIVLKNHCE
jgi:hypothetical protein